MIFFRILVLFFLIVLSIQQEQCPPTQFSTDWSKDLVSRIESAQSDLFDVSQSSLPGHIAVRRLEELRLRAEILKESCRSTEYLIPIFINLEKLLLETLQTVPIYSWPIGTCEFETNQNTVQAECYKPDDAEPFVAENYFVNETLECISYFSENEKTTSCSYPNGTEYIIEPPKCEDPLRISQKIVGGHHVDDGRYPWYTLLLLKKKRGFSVCGGSLITDRWVLTAAHCVVGDVSKVYAHVGIASYKLRALKFSNLITPERVLVHPEWAKKFGMFNDMALIKLSRAPDAIKNGVKMPICLAKNKEANVRYATAIGHGRTSTHGRVSQTLKEAVVQHVSQRKCERIWGRYVDGSQICEHSPANSTCNGDSGGTVMVSNGGSWYQIGVVSFGSSKGCLSKFPSVNSRITYFYDWIAKTVDEKLPTGKNCGQEGASGLNIIGL